MTQLLFADTRKPVPTGTPLKPLSSVAQPHTWRLESHQTTNDGGLVWVSRHHPKFGRVRRTFHPRVFGLVIEVDVSWHRAARTKIHRAWHEAWFGVVLGILALIPLAFFEQYHLADEITSVLSIFGSGEGGH